MHKLKDKASASKGSKSNNSTNDVVEKVDVPQTKTVKLKESELEILKQYKQSLINDEQFSPNINSLNWHLVSKASILETP